MSEISQNQPVLPTVSGSPLGINARTAARLQPRGLQPPDIFQKIDFETGEVLHFQQTKRGEKVYKTPAESRAEKFALKSVVNVLYPKSNTAKCCRCRRGHDDVVIYKSQEHGTAFYGGLVTCGSVWWCPVCAAKISERRRVELSHGIESANKLGLSVVLATFTVPHGLGDDVKLILDRMSSAWRFMGMSKGYKELRSLVGIVGTIRALEVTHGQNGFHPHYHVLFFCESSNPGLVSILHLWLSALWSHACVKKGLPRPSADRGVHCDDGTWAARYASKWGLEDEMTKGHMKTSKGIKGRSPWDLLRSALRDNCEKSRRLFAVYAVAFKGRRQLTWSRGLRDLLSVGVEFTDEELATKQEDNAFELSRLTTEQWRGVLFTRSESALLDLAERSPDQIPVFLSRLVAISQHVVPPKDFTVSDRAEPCGSE